MQYNINSKRKNFQPNIKSYFTQHNMIQYNIIIIIKPSKKLKLQKPEELLFFYALHSHFTISPIKQNEKCKSLRLPCTILLVNTF